MACDDTNPKLRKCNTAHKTLNILTSFIKSPRHSGFINKRNRLKRIEFQSEPQELGFDASSITHTKDALKPKTAEFWGFGYILTMK